jgi:transposase, IS5 family
MLSNQNPSAQSSFYLTLADSLNQKHPLYILAEKINWPLFEKEFAPLYCVDNGRPAKPIRLMVGLLLLKHIRNISDESVVEQWAENNYYQYFCGQQYFEPKVPCQSSELVHFRHRIGEKGIALIFQESIRINDEDAHDNHVSLDTTVQEKNITYPTDAKLHRKIINKCQQIAKLEALDLRQSYTRILKKLSIDQRFRNHPRNKAKARLVRELDRKLPPLHPYRSDLELFKKVLAQKKEDKQKIYSLHEPEVQCIAKGKEHKKYEFGNKVSIAYTQHTGVIVGALSFRNQYDGHTLPDALKQIEQLTGCSPHTATVDRGYRGQSQIGQTIIQIPKPFDNKKISKYKQTKQRKAFKRRAAIEPIIGHLKQDHRLSRNFYKGIFGDNINVMLSAAAFNIKRMMNKWAKAFLRFLRSIFYHFFYGLYPKDLFIRKFILAF